MFVAQKFAIKSQSHHYPYSIDLVKPFPKVHWQIWYLSKLFKQKGERGRSKKSHLSHSGEKQTRCSGSTDPQFGLGTGKREMVLVSWFHWTWTCLPGFHVVQIQRSWSPIATWANHTRENPSVSYSGGGEGGAFLYRNPASHNWSKACSSKVCFKKNLKADIWVIRGRSRAWTWLCSGHCPALYPGPCSRSECPGKNITAFWNQKAHLLEDKKWLSSGSSLNWLAPTEALFVIMRHNPSSNHILLSFSVTIATLNRYNVINATNTNATNNNFHLIYSKISFFMK